MSWRTRRESPYRGLTSKDLEWLSRFDQRWDTKSEGRSQTDAMDHLVDAFPERALPFEDCDYVGSRLDQEILTFARDLVGSSVIRSYNNRYLIDAHLTDGTTRTLLFKTLKEAKKYHRLIHEFMGLAASPIPIQLEIEGHEPYRQARILGTRDEDIDAPLQSLPPKEIP